MYICSTWFDFEVHHLLCEKIKQERVTRSMICNEVLSDFVKVASEFVSLRFSFSISTD